MGHYRTIENYREKYELRIAIGSPNKSRTPENPLNLEERVELLEACFPGLEKIPVADEDRGPEGYPEWAARLVEKTGADVVITRNDLVQEILEGHTGVTIEEQPLVEPEIYSGTEIRERIARGEDWESLVPDCSRDKTREFEDVIRRSMQ